MFDKFQEMSFGYLSHCIVCNRFEMMNMLIFKMSVNLTDEVPVDKEKNDWKRNEMDIRKKRKTDEKMKDMSERAKLK